ncbi:OsmC family peroxiredoxin [Halobellus sp. Atlit-31R]|nr:OsmC family peroxiredoxin [Halobellus sp. Atlit-31R]
MTGVNGLDTDELEALIGTAAENPDAASFTFRAETEWTGGFASETHIGDFEQNGETIESPEFTITGDEPAALLGERAGPNAVEHLLAAIGSCLSVTYAGHAAAHGIEIESLSFDFEGDIDLRGFLGLSDDVRPGYDQISVTTQLDADASEAELQELHEEVVATSPVYDNVTNEVSLDFDLQFE